MAKKRPFYKKFRRTLYETVSDSGNSVLRYRGHDDKEHYVASSEAPDIEPGGGGMEEVTWQELKDKRDAGKLTPGSLYRITDYNCTTTQENTQSAGHQFDIVLLALSENKLAEEGWAMMHDNIYDVTFSDGVTKKCYIYQPNDEEVYVVDCETLLGLVEQPQDITISENNTASVDDVSDQFTTPNLTYNYFQDSNLSAWKVWYCLDNDTSRFAWADDSVDEDVPAKIQTTGGRNYTFPTSTFIRNEQYDEIVTSGQVRSSYYAWVKDDDDSIIAYTTSNPPLVGWDSPLYIKGSRGFEEARGNKVDNYTPAHEGTGEANGRGVIYRLIDEFNNDVAYDFKNILYVRKLTDGVYDPVSGKDGWVYTFTNIDNNNIEDGSLSILNAYNKIILTQHSSGFKLPDIVSIDNGNGHSNNNFNGGINITIHDDVSNAKFINCANFALDDTNGAIYINKKKVLTES